MNIEYIATGIQDLDLIKPLWEKLNEHHRVRSKYFSGETAQRTFEDRKRYFTDKTGSVFRVDTVKDKDTGSLIGDCVSSISAEGEGEVDSIYVGSEYRKLGIGDMLMKRALSWLDSKQVRRKRIGVGAGNEEVFGFYSRYGFYPRMTILQQVERT